MNLACSLHDRGHRVEVCIYRSSANFFKKRLIEKNIKILNCDSNSKNKFTLIASLYLFVYRGNYDITMSFLDMPNLILEFISKFIRKSVLVVSERSSYKGFYNHRLFLLKGHFRGFFHSFADHVVTNSITQKIWLNTQYRSLANKVTCIYNGFRIGSIKPKQNRTFDKAHLKLLAVGRTSPEKNIINLIHGLNLFFKENNWLPSISWVGTRDLSSTLSKEYNKQLDELLDSLPLIKNKWEWVGEIDDLRYFYKNHDYLILPSMYEGLPNVVCEALIEGMPVLASDVCDNGNLVKDGERGFLFDPRSPQDISSAISRCTNLSDEEYLDISRDCQKYSHENLNLDNQVIKFENLFYQLLAC